MEFISMIDRDGISQISLHSLPNLKEMKIVNGAIELSASDLSNHLACKYLTLLNLQAAQGLIAQPTYLDPSLAVLQERGQEFEQQYLDGLRAEGLTVADPYTGTGGSPISRTEDAMRSGADVIYQASLKSGEWNGRADFLIKVDKSSNLGNYSYEVLDTKLARETRAGTLLQICLYSELLAQVQGATPDFMHVITPANGVTAEAYRCDDFMAYFRLIRARLLAAVRLADASGIYPEPVPQCEICSWWQQCDRRRRDDDHLSLVAGLSLLNTGEFNAWGVETLEQLALLPLPLQQRPSRGAIDTYVRLREQARMQFTARVNHAPYFESLVVVETKGLCKLPEPDAGDVFFDLEGDPFIGTTGLEYLFGWSADGDYNAIWSFSPEEEKAAFEHFVDLIMGRWAAHPGMHIYHYAAYEQSALKRLMGKYLSRENEIDSMLRADLFVDLFTVTRQAVRAGIERYSIKELEIFYGFERRAALRDAAAALRAAERSLERGVPEALSPDIKQVIADYNRDDCESTLALRDWLETLRDAQLAAGQVVLRPEMKTGEATEKIDEHDRIIRNLFERLIDGVPLTGEPRTAEQEGRWILAGMLDWYRREDKSKWWEYYRLRELPEDELLEEKAALAYLLPVAGSIVDVRKSITEQYSFPAQECELLAGDTLKMQDGKAFGSIAAIDKENGTVTILKGPSIKDLHPSAVFTMKFVPPSEKQQAVIRLSAWIVEHGMDSPLPGHRAARDLLMREPPRTKAGVDWSKYPLEAALAGVQVLDHGVLPIQGPPGAGKSYTASRMILAAIKTGKKVGITAMSHKVIRNLLEKVMEAATEENVQVRCLHKLTDLSDQPNPVIPETKSNPEVLASLQNGTVQVVGGTAWLWANEQMPEAVDILFVDEAGQLSLVDTLAASQGAKNLVLLGDQQQLKQPQQGSHPEGTTVSALEHILGEHKTIPGDKGIFLDQTRRMHPAICSFISELFYENRLSSVPGLERQVISGHPVIDGAGLWYIAVNHKGNQSSSKEEAGVIDQLVNGLLSGNVQWTSQKGETRPLVAGDIKIIAPYNAQVQEIMATTSYPIETGTVDKFQGQEAPIVIFSLATSAPENAPRGMEFLYSLNRLNVAVSRAKTACIIVGSPELFEPDCKSPAQIRLANAFCRYLEMATEISTK
ncbi:TM0106 family RecB-like putative nuclease [Mucilaginibacter sp. L196]|uniref:TM0106 family RecB-like putative nuclease n=1 Tax=Mucilaginibacter sp. L196 TaxID=1641870 RepID=UPI00131E0C80|nr:TM0106 family RecB-like putative nuclease [Mucilaginibacter sp. L196]